METSARSRRAVGSTFVVGLVVGEMAWFAGIAYVVLRLVG
jgi:hypothetical protein